MMMNEQETKKRFRSLGLPIRLFGEQSFDRWKRLQVAMEERHLALEDLTEKDEYRLGSGHGIRNHFLEKENDDDDENDEGQRNAIDNKQRGNAGKGNGDHHLSD